MGRLLLLCSVGLLWQVYGVRKAGQSTESSNLELNRDRYSNVLFTLELGLKIPPYWHGLSMWWAVG